MEQWNFILPEVILAGSILAMVVTAILLKRKESILYDLQALIGLGGALFFLFPYRPFQGGELHADAYSFVLRFLVYAVGLVMVILFRAGLAKGQRLPEWMMLMTGTVLGSSLLVMASNMVLLVLSIEILSILSYLMTAMRIRNAKAAEAAFKYLLFGGVSTAILLVGLSYLFALSGSMDLETIATISVDTPARRMLFFGSLVLVLAGLGYKVAAFPFHAWSPDVYQAVPLSVAAFFASVPKIAAVGLMMRLLVQWMPAHEEVKLLLAIIGVLTMTFGNFAALQQRNLKRLLAYSSIAHGGFAIATLAAQSEAGTKAVLFYLIAYAIMNVGAFAVLVAVLQRGEDELHDADIRSVASLGRKAGVGLYLALCMSVFLFSLTGIPPFVGFTGKFLVFSALAQSGLWLVAAIGALNALPAFYYYARIMHAMFFLAPSTEDDAPEQKVVSVPFSLRLLIGVLALMTLVLGVAPQLVLGFIE